MMFAPLLLSLSLAADPTTFNLWADKTPGPVSSDPKNVPNLTVNPVAADKANGCAVVVCPGGAIRAGPLTMKANRSSHG